MQKKANSYEDISWVLVWRYLNLRVSEQGQFLWRHLLSPSLKLCKFMSCKQKPILMKTFVESHFQVMLVYEFPTRATSYEDICWASVWSYVSFWVSKKSEMWWRHSFSVSLKLCKFMNYKQKLILMKTFVESQFEVM